MKKVIILLILVALASTPFAQQPENKQAQTQAGYLKKSRTQKTFAWISTGIGVLFIAGTSTIKNTPFFGAEEFDKAWTPGYYIGGALIATGALLFIASSKNKKRAGENSAFLKMERAAILNEGIVLKKPYPAVGVRIGL